MHGCIKHIFCFAKTHVVFPVGCVFLGVNLTSGQKVTAVILHVDILSTCVHVSILSKLVGKKKSVSVTLFTYILEEYDVF